MRLQDFYVGESAESENIQKTQKKNFSAKDTKVQTYEETIFKDKKRSFHFLPSRVSVLIKYWLFYFAIILYWETVLFYLSHQSTSLSQASWYMPFAISQSLFFAALSGWWKDRLNKIITLFWTLLLTVFYVAEFIYYQSFHSMISFSMAGMGADAISNFGWALSVTVKKSIGWLLVMLVPLFLTIIWQFFKRLHAGSYKIWVKPIALILVIFLWFGAASLFTFGGSKAKEAYTSSYTDIDTASEQLGVLTTAMLDLKGLFFGSDRNDDLSKVIIIKNPVDTLDPIETDPPETEPVNEYQNSDAPVPIETDERIPEETTEPEPEDPVIVYGPNILPEIDFDALSAIAPNDTIKTLCEYFKTQNGTMQNEYTGLFKDYNLIYICAESFQTAAISQEVTPTLYKLSHEGIVLNNYYNSFKNTTTNGEYTFMTGLWPDVSRSANNGKTNGSFYQSSANYMPYGLGNMFKQEDVKSYAFHNYWGSYYGREDTHPNLGYITKFMGDMTFTNSWPSSDFEMMQQSVDDFINEDRFNVYYMTFSGHGPYNTEKNQITAQNYSSVPSILNGKELSYGCRCYLANHIELDKALEYLLQRLEESGKLDNTLIVMAGDHFPYYLDVEDAETLVGYEIDEDFEYYHSTCIMWVNNLDAPIVVDTPCCNVDILPTVLNLLGIQYESRLLPGKDIFSDAIHMAIIYNKNFIIDKAKVNASTGNINWLIDVDSEYSESQKKYINDLSDIITTRYAVSLSINDTDFFRFVWSNSGLLKE